jgi:ABC-type nitrate/sulfonate/bicarbonate transport system ATPase subunit
MSHIDYAARTFGLELRAPKPPTPATLPLPEPGHILVVVGPSGCGKTLALAQLVTPQTREMLPLTRKELGTSVLELFGAHLGSESVLRALARAGLADGRLWCMKARHLSAGEQRRLELARALACAQPGDLLVADEFDTHLDCTTAQVLAQNLRRIARGGKLRLVVSTHRAEVLPYLAPDCLLEIDGAETQALAIPARRELADEIEIIRGSLRDYARFERWHYLGPGRPGPTSDVFIARHEGRPVGIALFGYPHLLIAARARALPEFAPARVMGEGAAGLNRDVRLLQRVVVDPRFRGIGISRRLIRHGLGHTNTRYVECIAQMGEFSDFLLAAGFERAGCIPPPAAVRALLNFTREHGIDPAQLIEPRSRNACLQHLPDAAAARLSRLLHAVARSRIQTGFGSLRRGGCTFGEPLLRKALARLHACPAYFLWTRGVSP